MNLYYNGKEVTPDLYVVEHIVETGTYKKTMLNFFSGMYSYQKAVIWCYENSINGKLIYCLNRQSQTIIDGLPIKRGRKKEIHKEEIKKGFYTQLIEPPIKLKTVL
jgi:hypothetical protein